MAHWTGTITHVDIKSAGWLERITILRELCSLKDPRRNGLKQGPCTAKQAGHGCACSGECLVPMTYEEIDVLIHEKRGGRL